MSATFRIRPYREGDEVAINRGFNATFGASRSLEEWRWKFDPDPLGRWIVLAVDDADRLMVHYGAVPVRVQADGAELIAGQVVDVYSDSSVGGGLGRARAYIRAVDGFIERYCGPEGLAVCFGFPSHRPLRLGEMRTHYDQVPAQPITRWWRAAEHRRRRRVPLFGPRVAAGFDAAAVDELWARCRERYPVAAVRDASWIGRRYRGRPGTEYTHVVVRKRRRPAAWGVARVAAPVTHWADLMWDGRDAGTLAALNDAVLDRAVVAGAERVEMWLRGDPAAEAVLGRLGWSGEPHPEIKMVVHVFTDGVEAARFAERFYVTIGDSDLV